MSITAQNTAKPSLAVEVFLALDELQALGPRLQYMASWSAPKTAIIWRDGKLCYEGFTTIEQVHFTTAEWRYAPFEPRQMTSSGLPLMETPYLAF